MQVPKLAGCNSQFAHVYQVHDAEQRVEIAAASRESRRLILAARREKMLLPPTPHPDWHMALRRPDGRSGGGGVTASTQSCDSHIWCLRKHPEPRPGARYLRRLEGPGNPVTSESQPDGRHLDLRSEDCLQCLQTARLMYVGMQSTCPTVRRPAQGGRHTAPHGEGANAWGHRSYLRPVRIVHQRPRLFHLQHAALFLAPRHRMAVQESAG
jgi:hypothetical protein